MLLEKTAMDIHPKTTKMGRTQLIMTETQNILGYQESCCQPAFVYFYAYVHLYARGMEHVIGNHG